MMHHSAKMTTTTSSTTSTKNQHEGIAKFFATLCKCTGFEQTFKDKVSNLQMLIHHLNGYT